MPAGSSSSMAAFGRCVKPSGAMRGSATCQPPSKRDMHQAGSLTWTPAAAACAVAPACTQQYAVAPHLLYRQAAGRQGQAGSATTHKGRVDPTEVEWTCAMAVQKAHLSPSLVTAFTVPASSVTPVPASRSLQRRQSCWPVQQYALSPQDWTRKETGCMSHSLTTGMSRAGDKGTGCNCAASMALDSPCHVEGRREGGPPPRRACRAAWQKGQHWRSHSELNCLSLCKQQDGSVCTEVVTGPYMRGCTLQTCQHLGSGQGEHVLCHELRVGPLHEVPAAGRAALCRQPT